MTEQNNEPKKPKTCKDFITCLQWLVGSCLFICSLCFGILIRVSKSGVDDNLIGFFIFFFSTFFYIFHSKNRRASLRFPIYITVFYMAFFFVGLTIGYIVFSPRFVDLRGGSIRHVAPSNHVHKNTCGPGTHVYPHHNVFNDSIPDSAPVVRFRFASDLHCTNTMSGKRPFTDYTALSAHWNDTPGFDYLLGDLIDATDDFAEYGRDVADLKNALSNFNNPLHVIMGNNDLRNNRQQTCMFAELVNYLYPGGALPGPFWIHHIRNSGVVVIGFYLPKTTPLFTSDAFNESLDDYQDIKFDIQKDKLDDLLSEAYNLNPRLILILAHQGFHESTLWSAQYELLNETNLFEFDKWKSFIHDAKQVIERYDDDSRSYAFGARPMDVVCISGHFHQGYLSRNIDGVDHIVCPKFSKGNHDAALHENNYCALEFDRINNLTVSFTQIDPNPYVIETNITL